MESTLAEMSRRPGVRIPRKREDSHIREARFQDYDQISALHIRNRLFARTHDEWTALWRHNPAYQRFEAHWPIGWVLENEKGEIVGSIGNIPFAYQFRGRELRVAATCSWVVDAAYRGYSMLLLDRLMRQQAVDCFICTSVSSASEASYGVFQWSKVPAGAWDKSAFWITNYQGFAKIFLGLKSIPFDGILSYPAALALWCFDRVRHVAPSAHPLADIEVCPEFDDRFDEFWEELKYENQDVLLAVRTREILSWRFRCSGARQGLWILTVSRGRRIVAYAVFDRQDNPATGLKRVRLVDFQALRGSESALSSALVWMLRRCREDGVHMLENLGCWFERFTDSRIPAPSHRVMNSWSYYYKPNSKALGETLQDPAVWAPTLFDGDASL